MRKTTKLLFKPHYWKSVYTDKRRVWRKSKLYKLYKKNTHSSHLTIAIILAVLFLSIVRVYAQPEPIQEVGIPIPKYERLEPIKAKKQAKVEYMAVKAEKPSVAPVQPTGECTGNKYADYIYMKESGCNPAAVNPAGCRGIGQACPGSKLPCEADLVCQHAYFTQYAADRYGGWEQAYNAWQSQGWW